MPNFPAVPEFPRPSSSSRKAKDGGCCSRTERCCCAVATWLPISIVYGATAWAIYVNGYLISISFISGFWGMFSALHLPPPSRSLAKQFPRCFDNLVILCMVLMAGWILAVLALILYTLCIWSYSVAVFTDPLSPIDAVAPPPFPNTIPRISTHTLSSIPNPSPNLPPTLLPVSSISTTNIIPGQRLLLPPPIHPLPRPHPAIKSNSQKRRPRKILPKMQLHETRPHPPLQHLQALYPQNGPPLSLVRQLYWVREL